MSTSTTKTDRALRLSDVPARVPEVVSRLIDGEAVLVHPRQGKIRVLNPVGARLWELVDGCSTVEALARSLATEYVVDLAQAQDDALAFFGDLVRRGVLTLVS